MLNTQVTAPGLIYTEQLNPTNGIDARKLLGQTIEIAGVAVAISSPFIGPEIAVPIAVGLELAGVMIENPPPVCKIAHHLRSAHYRSAWDTYYEHVQETTKNLFEEGVYSFAKRVIIPLGGLAVTS